MLDFESLLEFQQLLFCLRHLVQEVQIFHLLQQLNQYQLPQIYRHTSLLAPLFGLRFVARYLKMRWCSWQHPAVIAMN